MSRVQTDNSFFQDKIEIRMKVLPDKDHIKVLDCYSGKGLIWDEIKNKSNQKIDVMRIEMKRQGSGVYLRGDNLKFIGALQLDVFDVIDLDAYGMPYEQLQLIFKKGYKGVICMTFGHVAYNQLPFDFLKDLGYSKKMIRKCPTLFCFNGQEKFLDWLALKGVKNVFIIKTLISYLAFQTCK
ncbi:MAG: hypothetical protein CMI54_02450 [Parcubacteria group bacterium]|nr:hypothetical protein [Parcubacteria group bacterium]|tara:strand:+ start:14355 stop:14900 length:546 start_codon:yes stop_codon:yes gene_type:complete